MRYVSTRGGSEPVSAERAVINGLAPDGGLYVPESFPELSPGAMRDAMKYADRARIVMAPYFQGFDGMRDAVEAAYHGGRFDGPEVAPVTVAGGACYLELWHGPTCAFKDMALQVLPHLFKMSRKMTGQSGDICILTATSGDTGKAALEAFRDIPGIRVICFYPHGGVSETQRLQMVTQEGANLLVSAVRGNFDDAQSGVKKLFDDTDLKDRAALAGVSFSSANSINWGRLAPQIAYYVSAYAQMCAMGKIKPGDRLNFCVPTGNFGNILAGWIAGQMGLPLGRLICASNANNVLTDLIARGRYDRRRELKLTISPSMDILLSSNWERCLYLLSGGDSELVNGCMSSLREEGVYDLPDKVKGRLSEDFYGGCCGDSETKATIRSVFEKEGALLDPHTAVARAVYDGYVHRTGDDTPTVIVSTANAYKFCGAVLEALTGKERPDSAELAEELQRLTGISCPVALMGLSQKPVLHETVAEPGEMRRVVERFIKI